MQPSDARLRVVAPPPFCALILTAGRSRRMGRHKAWLTFQGETLIHRAARVAHEAGAERIVAVVGAAAECDTTSDLVHAQDVQRRVGSDIPHLITVQGAPDGTPIDSIRAGLGRRAQHQTVLLWPVDHPFAERTLIDALRRAIADAPDHIAVPVSKAGRGHPILFGARVADELLTKHADQAGARGVVHRMPSRIVEVSVHDPRLAAPINTPEQAAALGVRVDA